MIVFLDSEAIEVAVMLGGSLAFERDFGMRDDGASRGLKMARETQTDN